MSVSEPTPSLVPSTPNAASITIAAGQIRALLGVLAGMGVLGGVWASVSADQIATILTAVLMLGGLAAGGVASIWSWWQKIEAAKADHAGSVASANSGKPLKSTQGAS
jgi:hypothetical protein